MATAREWAYGYLQQALADMRAASVLQGYEPSVVAMLLQMVMEKLGKAALLRTGQVDVDQVRRTHRAASTMILLLARSPRACSRLGYSPFTIRYDLAPLVAELEGSHPVLNRDGPHLEYPWGNAVGTG